MSSDYELRMRVVAEDLASKNLDAVKASLTGLDNMKGLGLGDLATRCDAAKVAANNLAAGFKGLEKSAGSLDVLGKKKGVLDDLGGTVNGLASRLGHLAGIPVVAGFGAAGVAAAGFAATLKHGLDLAMEAEVQMMGAAGYGDTLAGTWDKAGLQVDKLSLSLGEALMPALQSSADALNDLLNSPEVEAGVDSLAKSIRTDLVPAIQAIPDAARAAGRAIQEMQVTFGFVSEALAMFKLQTMLDDPVLKRYGIGAPPDRVLSINDVRRKEGVPDWVTTIPQSTLDGLMSLDVAEFRDLMRGGQINAMLNAGQPADRWAGMNTWGGGIKASLDLQGQYTQMIRGLYPKDLTGAGAAANTVALSMSMPDVLARAFGTMGEAQSWMGAFQSAQGRAPGVVDVRDKKAGDLFAQQYGRAATDEEWRTRWKEGSFKGIDEKGAGLDVVFGKPGTWKTLIDEKGKQEAEQYKLLVAAFDKGTAATLAVVTAVDNLTEKITPAGSGTPPPATNSGRNYSESKYG